MLHGWNNSGSKALPMLEDDIQCQFFSWFLFQYRNLSKRIYHIPNGGLRNKVVAAKLKKQGVLPGVWDIFLSVPRGGFAGLYVETKAGKNDLTDNQIKFREANKDDYFFAVCYSLEEFQKAVTNYLNS